MQVTATQLPKTTPMHRYRVRFVPLVLSVLLLAVVPLAAHGQRDETHRGFNFAAGFGRGSMSIQCKGCVTDAQADISILLRVGYTIRENLFVAFEGAGLEKAQIVDFQTAKATFVFGGPVVLWYPRRYSEPFFKFGAGMSHSGGTFNVETGSATELELNSLTFTIGIGTDLRIGRTFSLTPFVDYYKPLSKDADLGSGATVTVSSAMFNLGLALTYH